MNVNYMSQLKKEVLNMGDHFSHFNGNINISIEQVREIRGQSCCWCSRDLILNGETLQVLGFVSCTIRCLCVLMKLSVVFQHMPAMCSDAI